MSENLYCEVQGLNPGDSAASVVEARSVQRRTKGYVILDSTWARRLGVRRSGGMYRIVHRELMERLRLQQVPMDRVLNPSALQGGRGHTVDRLPLDDIVALGHSHLVGFYETEAFLVDSVRMVRWSRCYGTRGTSLLPSH